jgi:hypothetical protein
MIRNIPRILALVYKWSMLLVIQGNKSKKTIKMSTMRIKHRIHISIYKEKHKIQSINKENYND